MNVTQPEVELLVHAPIGIVIFAARQCTDTQDQGDTLKGELSEIGEKDKELIQKRILKSTGPLDPSHESVLEHLTYTFQISEISRAVLQEIARHRMSSPSVKSTRFALQKIKSMTLTELSKQIVLTGHSDIDLANFAQLQLVQEFKIRRIPNDVAKYALPDAFKTEMIWTINARSLRNFLALRTSTRALSEIRQIAFAMYNALPESHKFIFEDRLHDCNER